MSSGRRSRLGDILDATEGGPTVEPRKPPERLSTRTNALAALSTGDVDEKTIFLVDPGVCRPWSHHNRRYDLLNPGACADLLESLKSQGRQEFPAIVRRLGKDDTHQFEIICGARRHWSVTYLRTVEHRDIKFAIEVRDLSDEEAFRLADIENRARQDISPIERARDYRFAMNNFYNGRMDRMAERLEINKSTLSRFIDLAALPDEIVEAYSSDLSSLKEHHARALKPLLQQELTRTRVLQVAREISDDHKTRRESGLTPLDGKAILNRLLAAGSLATPSNGDPLDDVWVKDGSGSRLFRMSYTGKKRATFVVPLDTAGSVDDTIAQIKATLLKLRETVTR